MASRTSLTGKQASTIDQRIQELGPWFHNLRLAGIQTAPHHFLGDYPQVKYERFKRDLPLDLSGCSVLDIGCNAGFYSLEMKKRGAARVVGIDIDNHYLDQARFAAEVNDLDIEFHKMSVWELGSLEEKFDLVLFMGVFYHLRHPLLALDLIHEHVAKDLFIFQSMQRGSTEIAEVEKDYDFNAPAPFDEPGYPKMHFVEESYSHDVTNWWIPNRACVEAMLRSAGFTIQSQPEEEVYVCRWQELHSYLSEQHCVYPHPGKKRK